MRLDLGRRQIEGERVSKRVSSSDVDALGALMLEAYRGTIDYEGESLEDAVAEVRGTLEGKYGDFLESCSYVIEVAGRAASASLVVLSHELGEPLLAYSMTHPDFKRQGMAANLLRRSINSLMDEGFDALNLVVTEGNTGARRLYERVGFRAVG
jgi:predicted GNAT family acetyltransferase